MKATVDAILCVGCGLCTEICPDVFTLEGALAIAKAVPSTPRAEADCRDAAEQCPVTAITITESPLKDEDGHVDQIEEKLGQIKQMGLQNLLAIQAGD